jgi:hypothetical protein
MNFLTYFSVLSYVIVWCLDVLGSGIKLLYKFRYSKRWDSGPQGSERNWRLGYAWLCTVGKLLEARLHCQWVPSPSLASNLHQFHIAYGWPLWDGRDLGCWWTLWTAGLCMTHSRALCMIMLVALEISGNFRYSLSVCILCVSAFAWLSPSQTSFIGWHKDLDWHSIEVL